LIAIDDLGREWSNLVQIDRAVRWSPDVAALFVTRMVRLFAYGAISVILVLYLGAIGLSDREIGVLLTMTLLGDTVISLWLTTAADRVGRKRTLIVGAALMAAGGLVFALASNYWLLLAAATLGVISPSGNEVGPFLAIEQAALAQITPAEQRTRVFAWYHLAGSLATAAGALACGGGVHWLQSQAVQLEEGYRAVLYGYAVAGVLLGIFFLRLSAKSEAEVREDSAATVKRRLGLHRSRGVVLRLSALFALDAFAGGFVLQSMMAYWFYIRFGANVETLGAIFFGANLLAGISGLAAAWLAQRIGLVNTMVFTHVPSNVLLILVPLMPSLPLAVAVLLLRFSISQMDVPARQSYTAAVVDPDERSAAAGVTGVARTTGAALAPALAGQLIASPAGYPFMISGVLKLIYDFMLYRRFRAVRPPEEQKTV
jgi:MFS family permease